MGVELPSADSQLLRRLDRLREVLEWKCSGVDRAGVRVTIARSSVTLGGLLKHLALVEDDYFTLRFLGRPLPLPWDEVDFGELAEWAWNSAANDEPDELLSLWRAAVERSRAITRNASMNAGFDQTAVLWPEQPPATLRDIVLDLTEEYARHCGHADLLRESIDGVVGEDPP